MQDCRRTWKRLGLLPVVVALASCSSGGGNPEIGPGDSLGRTADDNYRVAFQTCSAMSPEALAKDLDVTTTDAESIARAYAELYSDEYAADTNAGCLDALVDKPMARS